MQGVGQAGQAPLAPVAWSPSANSPNAWVGRLTGLPSAARPAQAGSLPALVLFPNPAHTTVGLPPLPAGTVLTLTDALGRPVRQQAAAAVLAVAGLPPGLYHLLARAPAGQQWAGRLQVE